MTVNRKLRPGEGQQKVERLFRAHPGEPLRNSEVAEMTGVPQNTVSAATRTLRQLGRLRKIQSGVHVYDVPARGAELPPIQGKATSAINNHRPIQPVIKATPTLFEMVTEVADGRLILRDEDGCFWLAGPLR